MTILTPGKIPANELLFQGTCSHCNAKIECDFNELTELGEWKYIKCPTIRCTRNITLINKEKHMTHICV